LWRTARRQWDEALSVIDIETWDQTAAKIFYNDLYRSLNVPVDYTEDGKLADIASSLERPMSTVKARLRYARAKISKGVEALEKSGTALHGAAPVPLVIWFLKNAAVPGATKLRPVILDGAAAGGTETRVLPPPQRAEPSQASPCRR